MDLAREDEIENYENEESNEPENVTKPNSEMCLDITGPKPQTSFKYE